jgi:HEPN superfamily AbiU2-like protein
MIRCSCFRRLQEELWEMSLLHIARLTDPPFSFGNKDKPNLSFKALPNLVTDAKAKADVTTHVEQAIKATEFARDWRNRQIAHKDLKLVLS